MTATEYLAQSEQYSPYPGIYILRTTSTLLRNCSGSFVENNIEYSFYKTNDYDGRIIQGLPKSIDFQLYYRKEFIQIIKRLNKFFLDMVETIEKGTSNNDCELVNLRINVNLIYKLPLSIEQKRTWADWIKELYWNRKVLLNQWYIDYVLPFQVKEYRTRVVVIGFTTIH